MNYAKHLLSLGLRRSRGIRDVAYYTDTEPSEREYSIGRDLFAEEPRVSRVIFLDSTRNTVSRITFI